MRYRYFITALTLPLLGGIAATLLAHGAGAAVVAGRAHSDPNQAYAVHYSAALNIATVPVYGYEVKSTWEHDRRAFTQGLSFYDGVLFESTGHYNESNLRTVDLQSGHVLKEVALGGEYFGEGMTVMSDCAYVLTWTNRKGFIFDAHDLAPKGTFTYSSEGWGLTNDGRFLIMSDGTNSIRFLDPKRKFKLVKTIAVFDGAVPLMQLNELEYVNGEIFANIWHSDRIARIAPASGKLLGWIDLSNILITGSTQNSEDCLNGIAFDAHTDRLFVTGKRWPKLFQIEIKPKSSSKTALGTWLDVTAVPGAVATGLGTRDGGPRRAQRHSYLVPAR